MKKRYQIDKQHAVQQFRQLANQEDQAVQLVIPLKEVVDLIQRGLMNLAMSAFTQLAEQVMGCEVTALVGPKNQVDPRRAKVRWGSEPGYCVVNGQKIPLERPRVRDTRKKEVPLGSYEMLQRASLMEESGWRKMMNGLTTRRYSDVVKELEQAYGIEKSAISLGITVHGQKIVLGLRQGATENATVVKQLLSDLRERGVDFEVPHLYILVGCKALPSSQFSVFTLRTDGI